jgi:hypothetical protein
VRRMERRTPWPSWRPWQARSLPCDSAARDSHSLPISPFLAAPKGS